MPVSRSIQRRITAGLQRGRVPSKTGGGNVLSSRWTSVRCRSLISSISARVVGVSISVGAKP
jgi:hypothetical protein